MMIHMFSGQWPQPQVGQIRSEPDGRMTPVSEAERRDVLLRAIGNDHPLFDLILKCIHNHPQARAHASEIVGRLAEMVLQFPISFANRLDEALRQPVGKNQDLRDAENREPIEDKRQIKTLTKQNRDLQIEKRGLRAEVEKKDREIQKLRTEIEQLKIETARLDLQNFSPSRVS
jgi:hypothetical protein